MYVCLWVEKVDCSKTVRQIKMQESAFERAIWMHSEASDILFLRITKTFLFLCEFGNDSRQMLGPILSKSCTQVLMHNIPFEFVNSQHPLSNFKMTAVLIFKEWLVLNGILFLKTSHTIKIVVAIYTITTKWFTCT